MEESSQHHAWVHSGKARYYRVYLDRDLFGHWTLRKVWGGIGSSRGRMHNTGIPSYDEGVEQIREIAKRRIQHGYRRVFSPPSDTFSAQG
jgi:cytochrome b